MKHMPVPSLALLAVLLAAPAAAQEPAAPTPEQQMAAVRKAGTPGPQHARLAAGAGTYDLTVRSWYGPGEPAVDTGTATRRMILGDRVLVEEVEAQLMGEPFTGFGLHGYDNITGQYWATWNDSMSTQLLSSEGNCDDDGRCVFISRYHDPVTGRELTSRITTRQLDADSELFEMFGPGPDGSEAKMMEITYHRRGP